MFAPGPSSTLTPCDRHSTASVTPTLSSRFGDQQHARAVAVGKHVAGTDSSTVVSLTVFRSPCGPSHSSSDEDADVIDEEDADNGDSD